MAFAFKRTVPDICWYMSWRNRDIFTVNTYKAKVNILSAKISGERYKIWCSISEEHLACLRLCCTHECCDKSDKMLHVLKVILGNVYVINYFGIICILQ